MKCTKPSGPYIAILAVLFILSFAGIPTGNDTHHNEAIEDLTNNDNEGEDRLKQVENISMLNVESHE